MKLSSYLTSKFVFIDLEISTIEEVISKTVDNLSLVHGEIKKKASQVKESLLERENKMSTAIGDGISMPHARIDGFEDFIVSVVKIKKPIIMKNEAKQENEEVQLFIFIISNTLKNADMLKIMRDFAKLAKDDPKLINNLKNASSESQVVKLLDKTSFEMTHDMVAEDVMNTEARVDKPSKTLEEIENIFINENVYGMAIIDDNGDFKGEICARDLMSYGMPKFPEFEDFDFMTGKPFKEYSKNKKNVTVAEICEKNERIIVKRDTPIMEIWFLVVVKGMRRLYVVENGKYLGTISSLDVLKKVQNMK